MYRSTMTRREWLRLALRAPKVASPQKPEWWTNHRLRPLLLMAALLCWIPLTIFSVHHEGPYHATVCLIGLPGSPWLEYRSTGATWSGVMVHVTSWSALLAVTGWVLLRTYRRPRALAAVCRFLRELSR